jgi:hypothetical protein
MELTYCLSYSFMQTYNEGCGWVLKAPFVTNSMHFLYFLKEPDDIVWKLELVSRAVFEEEKCYVIPYMMLQPRMQNRKEYKVVLLNGERKHIFYDRSQRRDCGAFSKESPNRLFEFAQNALHLLRKARPHAILDYLVRVDVFETQEKETYTNEDGKVSIRNRWVVNEFESLEAQFSSSGDNDSEVYKFCNDYWLAKLENAVELALSLKK